MKKMLKVFANMNILMGVILLVTPIGFLTYYAVFPGSKVEALYDASKENEIIVQPIFTDENKPKKSNYDFKDPFGGRLNSETLIKPLEFTVPANDVADIGTRIRIPSLKIDTSVYESWNIENALVKGVWRDPKHGTPDRFGEPVVIAAHRWGENWFSWEYRKQHLFADFDQLQTGKEVIIIWNNVEYKYMIDHIEQNTYVSRSADLILYTCVDYNSSERIIVYANRI